METIVKPNAAVTGTGDGRYAALTGMALASARAEYDYQGWNDRAWALFAQYLRQQPAAFMGEDYRLWAYEQGLPKPNSERAFGFIFCRAARQGLIVKQGMGNVKNTKAHFANAAIWIRA
jgi:hypothetical protein